MRDRYWAMARRSMAWNMCIWVTLVPKASAAMPLLFMFAPSSAWRSGSRSWAIRARVGAARLLSSARFSQKAKLCSAFSCIRARACT
ncbi:hypothetical protein D3C80_1667280 [compost metagenome]